MIGGEHHDAFDDFSFLFGDQPFVPKQSNDMRNLVAFIDEL